LRAADELRRRAPGVFWTRAGALVLILVAASASYLWIKSRPKPEYLAIAVSEPSPTRLEKDAKPDPLRVSFSGAAAPIERIGKELKEGLSVTPPVAGTWRWESDRTLVFTPAEDWPVGQEYKLEFGRSFFAPQALLESRRIRFHAPALTASLASQDFYEDPTDPKNKRVVVAIQFTHRVDKASVEKRLSLRMRVDPETRFNSPSARSLGFKLTFDETGGKVFVQSEPIAIPDRPGAVQVTLATGVQAVQGGEGTAEPVVVEVAVPGVETYFRVARVQGSVVTNDSHKMERVVAIEFTAPVRVEELRAGVTAYELPVNRPAVGAQSEEKNHVWQNAEEVVPEVLAQARRIDLIWLPSEPEYSKLQSFRFEAPAGRTLYVHLEKGTKAFGDYALARPFAAIVKVDDFPRAIQILHDGSLLALTGGKKLSVMTQNLSAVQIELARVLPGAVAHLASQTRGRFQDPSFSNYDFDIDNLAEVFHEVRTLAAAAPGEPQYFALDFASFLSRGTPPRGLFRLEVVGWDPEKKVPLSKPRDRRIVLLTDLGFLVKDSLDGSHEVFVISIASGLPVAGAEVQILGKNGLPVASRITDAEGRALLPKTEALQRDKTPAVYVVQKDGDLSFLPYQRSDRKIDLSRFDVGGLYDEKELESLQACLFSDRGVYRPGEEVTVGAIVKTLDWKALPDGLPLEISVVDPRGLEIRNETLRLPREGLRDWRFSTLEASPTGTYQIQLYIVKDAQRRGVLGQTSVRVEEFLPDRMTINARLSAPPSQGWISPKDLRARVSLRNLFGTPAIGNRIKGTLRLSPTLPAFPGWEGWSFFDPIAAKQSFDETLAELSTNDAGEAEFSLGLERFERATYRLRFVAEGFESESGRGVAIDTSAVVSPLPYLIAWKADGDLSFVKRGSARSIEVLAVGPNLDPVDTQDVTAELIEISYVSVLAQQPSGLLAYQSVKKEVSRGKQTLALSGKPAKLPLATDRPGRFLYVLRDGGGVELNRVPFDVQGEGNVAGRIERNAELQVKLAKGDYAPGEEIEVSVQAPYSGAGLLTIERDRVYAAHWFKADGNATIQRIRVPEDLEGNGYVVVSFVRDLTSREIFLSPLSNGAAPFSVSRERRTQHISLHVPERVLPGAKLHLGWETATPTKLVVFAVDEGILQVARWRSPDPLAHFFRKRALAVTTAQILDLILPEYDIVRATAAPGGDQDRILSGNLNPFKRKGQKPVAFWSGVLDVPAGPGSVDYEVPDYFHGTVRVLAVAVNESTIGIAETRTLARGPFVVQPTAPYFVAPGDEFDATALVSNTLEGSGPTASVKATLETSNELEIVGPSEQPLTIPEGRDVPARWHIRAKGGPGTARLSFRATSGSNAGSSTLETSIRPAAPSLTTVVTHVLPRGGSAELAVDRKLYPEMREVTAAAATSPLGLIPGLARYLDQYPHGCSEQIVSIAFPGVILGVRPELGIDPERAAKHFAHAIAVLRGRQNADGAFGLWSPGSDTHDFVNAYATHFLMEARARGQAVPEAMFRRALDYLGTEASEAEGDLSELRAKSYAVYLLTRAGQVKTKEARALRDTLLKEEPKRAKEDVAALFLAATFAQLHLDDEARQLLGGFSLDRTVEADYGGYDDTQIERALSLYLLSQHFPDRARSLPAASLLTVAEGVGADAFNTLSSALMILALDAWSKVVPPADARDVQIHEIPAQGSAHLLPLSGTSVLHGPVTPDALRLRFSGPSGLPLFYQLLQSGFDLEAPKEKAAHGLEVSREIRAPGGEPVTQTSVASKLDVVLWVRSVDNREREVAVVDLLPGGFEVDLSSDALASRQSLNPGQDSWAPRYVDVREDRVVLYGWVSGQARRFVYRIKPTNRGRYQVPPVLIEGLYDRSAWGRGTGGELRVGD
jgi:uncharacterized protein YfaS (alpha-2-macroglobulin family)